MPPTEVVQITDFSMLLDQELAELDRIGSKLTSGCQSTEEVR